MVVYLPVENQNITTAGGMHGLVARWGQVNDGKTPKP
jgi:hypothetical protein